MAKMITRTITVHTYTTGALNFNTMKLEKVQNHSFPYKLNERQKRSLAKEAGNPIVAETSGEALYAMTIDDFIKYAKPVESEDTGVSEVDNG